jgi:hypothetical protein
LIHYIGEFSGYGRWRCAPNQKLARMRIQHHDLGIGEAVPDNPMEFAWLKIRQRRVQKKHSIVGCVLVEQLQRFGSA